MSHTNEQIKALADQLISHPVSRSIDEIELAGDVLIDLLKQRDELLAAQYVIAQGAAQLAIEKCKNATGRHRSIDMFVSANQCAKDIIKAVAIASAKGSAS